MFLQEFYDIGFVEISKISRPVRRIVLNTDPHYQEIQDFAKSFEYKSNGWWDTLRDYIYDNFKYYLEYVGSQGDKITEVCCYFDDPEGERVILQLNDIELDIYYNKKNKFIYRIYDRYSYFQDYHGETEIYAFTNSSTSILMNVKDFMERLLKYRKEDNQRVKNYFNKELKNVHRTYRSVLDRSNSGINSIKKYLKEKKA